MLSLFQRETVNIWQNKCHGSLSFKTFLNQIDAKHLILLSKKREIISYSSLFTDQHLCVGYWVVVGFSL